MAYLIRTQAEHDDMNDKLSPFRCGYCGEPLSTDDAVVQVLNPDVARTYHHRCEMRRNGTSCRA